jgi:hypothetical protein
VPVQCAYIIWHVKRFRSIYFIVCHVFRSVGVRKFAQMKRCENMSRCRPVLGMPITTSIITSTSSSTVVVLLKSAVTANYIKICINVHIIIQYSVAAAVSTRGKRYRIIALMCALRYKHIYIHRYLHIIVIRQDYTSFIHAPSPVNSDVLQTTD